MCYLQNFRNRKYSNRKVKGGNKIMCENNKGHKHVIINILPQSPVAWFFIMWIGIFFACAGGGK